MNLLAVLLGIFSSARESCCQSSSGRVFLEYFNAKSPIITETADSAETKIISAGICHHETHEIIPTFCPAAKWDSAYGSWPLFGPNYITQPKELSGRAKRDTHNGSQEYSHGENTRRGDRGKQPRAAYLGESEVTGLNVSVGLTRASNEAA